MAKKALIVSCMMAMCGAALFAQAKNNWLSGELSLIGAGLRYERMINPSFSLGANAYASTMILWGEVDAGATMRFYPGGGQFFTGLGVGYHIHWAPASEFKGTVVYKDDTKEKIDFADDDNAGDIVNNTGIGITPELGFKIDVGQPGGFFISPGIKVPVTLGWREPTFVSIGKNMKNAEAHGGVKRWENNFGVDWGIVVFIGLGGAF